MLKISWRYFFYLCGKRRKLKIMQISEVIMVFMYMRGAVIPTSVCKGIPTTLSLRRGYTVPTIRGFIKSLLGH